MAHGSVCLQWGTTNHSRSETHPHLHTYIQVDDLIYCTMNRNYNHYFGNYRTHVRSHMYDLTCTISHVQSHMYDLTCTISHVRSHMYDPTCTISHVQSRMYNLTCTISHVQSHMYNLTCGISHAGSHMRTHLRRTTIKARKGAKGQPTVGSLLLVL